MTDTDDLLNEATRLATDPLVCNVSAHVAETLLALAERVRELWEANEVNSGEATIFRAERDEARGKLDAVRALAGPGIGRAPLAIERWVNAHNLLAILDGK